MRRLTSALILAILLAAVSFCPAASAQSTDVPKALSNVRGKDMGVYVTLQWDAVGSVGLNGGFVAQSQVYYNVYRAEPIFEFGQLTEMRLSYLKHVKTLRTDVDVPGMNEGEFENIFFGICAETPLGEGPMTYVEFQKGQKYDPPYMESFTDGETSTYLEVRSDRSSMQAGVWLHPDSADDDSGAAAFYSNTPDAFVELRTAKIWLAACPTPQLRFSAKNASGENRLDIGIITPDNVRHPIAAVIPGDQYENLIFDLSDYSSGLWMRVSFIAEFDETADPDDGWQLDLDDIKAGDAADIGIRPVVNDEREEPGNVYSADGHLLRRNARTLEGLKGIVVTRSGKRILH